MEKLLNYYAQTMVMLTMMTLSFGCTSYTTIPRVYTPPRRVATYTPQKQYQRTYIPASLSYSPSTTQSTNYPPATSRVITRTAYDVEAQAAEISRRVNRQAAEIEAKVKRQTEEIQRRVDQQAAAATRQVAQATYQPVHTTKVAYPQPNTRLSSYPTSDSITGLPYGVSYFPHVKLDDGFVPHVFGNDTRALLIWPVTEDVDVKEAARNLLAAKRSLRRSEPEAVVGMVLLVANGQVENRRKWEAQGIRCFNAAQFPAFADSFFSQSDGQSSSSGEVVAYMEDVDGDESDWKSTAANVWSTIVAKSKEWGGIAKDFLDNATWWMWGIGVAIVFIIVFFVSSREERHQPVRTRRTTYTRRNNNPWVIDPSER